MGHDLVEADNVETEVWIAGDEWEIIDMEVVLTTRSTPDYVTMVITPADGTPFPAEPSNPDGSSYLLGEDFILAVNNELRADTPGPEVNRIFTGTVANMTGLGDYTYQAIAHDPSQQTFGTQLEGDPSSFMNSTINIAPASPRIMRKLSAGAYTQSYEPGGRKIKVSELMEIILDEAGVPNPRREINIVPGGTYEGRGDDIEITFSEWEIPVKEALDRASSASKSDWWFDRFGKFHFGPRIPNENIFAYKLKYITDASDGKTTPPYRSVQVIGDGVSSEEGWSKSSLMNENPVTASRTVEIDTDNADLAEPVYTYRNMEINTKREAENTADDIKEQLEEQTGTGDVTVVGFPELRPGDGIVMPNSDRQPMGGRRYGIEQVTHRLNTSDGFITKVGVAGLSGAQEVLTEELVEELEGELEAQWRMVNTDRGGVTGTIR